MSTHSQFEPLLKINEPHLVERYRHALRGFGINPPELKEFHVDMSGFSPEVAELLKDEDYLDPKDKNRRFIILSPEQANMPVIHSSFSNTQDLMTEFFEANLRELYALTIKDVVFGEIDDSVFAIDDIDDLLSIEEVEFIISTPKGLPEKTARLKVKMERLLKEPDAWQDTAMLNSMVELAKQTGDIRDNELSPKEVFFRHENYWTSHFGGTYIFNDDEQITVICDPKAKGFRKSRPWQVSYISIHDQRNVYRFLEETNRIEEPEDLKAGKNSILELRMQMAALWLAKSKNQKLPDYFPNHDWMESWYTRNKTLAEENGVIPLLEWAINEIENQQEIDLDDVDTDHAFVLCRANPQHPDMALTSRLISEYLPFDFITRFQFNRPNFNKDQRKWGKGYNEFVAKALNQHYLKGGQKLYDNLFG